MKFMPRKREDFFPKLFQSDLDSDFFDRFFKESNYPQVDVKEANGQYEVVVDVPGFSKEDIQVDFKDGYLSISGKKEESSETSEDEGHYIRKERSLVRSSAVFMSEMSMNKPLKETSKTVSCN